MQESILPLRFSTALALTVRANYPMKTIASILIFLSGFVGYSQNVTSIEQQFNDEKELISEKLVTEGNDTVKWITYQDQNIFQLVNLINKRKNGKAYIYYDSGNPMFITEYTDDKKMVE